MLDRVHHGPEILHRQCNLVVPVFSRHWIEGIFNRSDNKAAG
jgi:hypothetical protein